MRDKPAPQVLAFLRKLEESGDEELLWPPSHVGPYTAAQLRRALETEALVIHRAGMGFAWAYDSPAFKKWQQQVTMEDRASKKAGATSVRALLTKLQRMDWGLERPKEPAVTVTPLADGDRIVTMEPFPDPWDFPGEVAAP